MQYLLLSHSILLGGIQSPSFLMTFCDNCACLSGKTLANSYDGLFKHIRKRQNSHHDGNICIKNGIIVMIG